MKSIELIEQSRELVLGHYYASMATQGEYPFVSLVRYSLDRFAQPVLLLSRIAEHTKNLKHSNKVSLMVLDNKHRGNIQECSRITLVGTLENLSPKYQDYQECLQGHYTYFPESQSYYEQLDFDIYRLQVQSCRYVGGFAAAHSLSGEKYCQENPLSFSERQAIMTHMNEDHADALEHYCQQFSCQLDGEHPVLVGLDRVGFNIRIGQRIERFLFPFEVVDRVSASDAFVSMAKA